MARCTPTPIPAGSSAGAPRTAPHALPLAGAPDIPPQDFDTAAAEKRAEASLYNTDPDHSYPYSCCLDEKRQRLYTFKSRSGWDRAQVKVAPSGYIDAQIIEDNWNDILRFIATIKLKETTASEIFRRLNSYSKQHALYRALKSFGKIIKSIFILRYIDDLELRQAIEKQLNKKENSHQFSRAVSFGNPREFTQAEKQEQEVAEGCKRLIKNAITCWNYLYLSQKISEVIGPEAREILFHAIANGSVISWQHINLRASMIFRTKSCRITLESDPQK